MKNEEALQLNTRKVLGELKVKFGLATTVLESLPRPDCFENIVGWTFPVIDGSVASGYPWWMRLSVTALRTPEFVQDMKMKWYYVVGVGAVDSPEMITQVAKEIQTDAYNVIERLYPRWRTSLRHQSAVRVPIVHATDMRQSDR